LKLLLKQFFFSYSSILVFNEPQIKTVIFTSHPDLSCHKQVFMQSFPEINKRTVFTS